MLAAESLSAKFTLFPIFGVHEDDAYHVAYPPRHHIDDGGRWDKTVFGLSSKASLGVPGFPDDDAKARTTRARAASRLVFRYGRSCLRARRRRSRGRGLEVWPARTYQREPAQDSCQGFSWRLRCARRSRFEVRRRRGCSFRGRMVREDGIEVDGARYHPGRARRVGKNACGFGAAY